MRSLPSLASHHNLIYVPLPLDVFPEAFLQQMTSLQASSNEFLRQFWSAVLPAKGGDVSANALATPAQKAGKAERMKGYLMKMEDHHSHELTMYD